MPLTCFSPEFLNQFARSSVALSFAFVAQALQNNFKNSSFQALLAGKCCIDQVKLIADIIAMKPANPLAVCESFADI